METVMWLRTYLQLFISFFKVGLFTFGGGYAMLPMLRKEIVDKKHWADEQEVLDYFSISQSAPGIIAINAATFIGYKVGKAGGAVMAAVGITMPSLIIITLIAALLGEYEGNIYVQKALTGIRGAVVALIAAGVLRMIKQSRFSIIYAVLILTGFGLMLFTPISPVLVVMSAIAVGLLMTIWKRRKKP